MKTTLGEQRHERVDGSSRRALDVEVSVSSTGGLRWRVGGCGWMDVVKKVGRETKGCGRWGGARQSWLAGEKASEREAPQQIALKHLVLLSKANIKF